MTSVSPRFVPGDPVRVRIGPTDHHNRTPRYIRGKRGVVERCCGAFRNPEELAYGRWEGERIPLYRVRFAQADLWDDYPGAAADTLDIELYEHWLKPASDER